MVGASPAPQSKASILWHSAFFMVQLSHLYMTTGKTIAFTIWTYVGKVMSLLFIFYFLIFFLSLLFNMLSRFVIAFLPRSKRLFSWLHEIKENPRKRKLGFRNNKGLCPSREIGIKTEGSQFICLCLAFKPFICGPCPTSSDGLFTTPTLSRLSQSQFGWYCCLQKFIPTSAPLVVTLRPFLFIPLTISFLKYTNI
ncbi:unnamed protein product [Rangifer tarandus platyrhynchus]|uniref:Uncharacterized protein n=1 Tax=Rangifer tarandus platyrhynchus TaxID=3082113 RepID=A0ABN8XUI6_RANTA|nr:unnamed protein product [Rangifer tarandus platyrhynchus]